MPASAPAIAAVALAGEELLDAQGVVAGALDDPQERRHLGDFLDLLLDEPLHELLAREVAALARHAHEVGALIRDAPLLLERQRDRLGEAGERRLRRLDARDHDGLVRVEQVLDHDHRVVALLDGLPVEQPGELRKGVGVVVHGDRDVLLRGGELVGDLRGELVGEAGGRHVRQPRSRADGRRATRYGGGHALRGLAILVACTFAAGTSAAAGPKPPTLPGARNCPIFPATNVWNKRVDTLPVAANSDALIKRDRRRLVGAPRLRLVPRLRDPVQRRLEHGPSRPG